MEENNKTSWGRKPQTTEIIRQLKVNFPFFLAINLL